jgi:flagellar biogenesis protein FliO
MTALQAWLSRPRASVRIDTSVRWEGWLKALRQFSSGKRKSARPRLEVLDRLSLGGKKSLLLVSLEGCRLLVGVGESAAPTIMLLDPAGPRKRSRASRAPRARRGMGA